MPEQLKPSRVSTAMTLPPAEGANALQAWRVLPARCLCIKDLARKYEGENTHTHTQHTPPEGSARPGMKTLADFDKVISEAGG